MLKSHMRNCEKTLCSQYLLSSTAGHTLHRGLPRERFIEDFLKNHLPSTVDIGTGEIIDCHSAPRDARNQHDIVLFQRTFPRLHFGGDSYGFLVESVSATIEVKSLLDKAAIKQAIGAAYTVKHLDSASQSGITIGGTNRLFSGVVAYAGPENMTTVSRWAVECEKELGISSESSASASVRNRSILSPTLDSILVLGKGVTYNSRYGGLSFGREIKGPWVSAESDENDNLILFFMQLMGTLSTIRMNSASLNGYLSSIQYQNVEVTKYDAVT